MIESIGMKDFGESEAEKRAYERILIDASNRNEVTKQVRWLVSDKSLQKAQIIVLEALGEKRIARAVEWFEQNDFNYQEALFILIHEFTPPGNQSSRKMATSIFNEAFRRCGKELP